MNREQNGSLMDGRFYVSIFLKDAYGAVILKLVALFCIILGSIVIIFGSMLLKYIQEPLTCLVPVYSPYIYNYNYKLQKPCN